MFKYMGFDCGLWYHDMTSSLVSYNSSEIKHIINYIKTSFRQRSSLPSCLVRWEVWKFSWVCWDQSQSEENIQEEKHICLHNKSLYVFQIPGPGIQKLSTSSKPFVLCILEPISKTSWGSQVMKSSRRIILCSTAWYVVVFVRTERKRWDINITEVP